MAVVLATDQSASTLTESPPMWTLPPDTKPTMHVIGTPPFAGSNL
jgi:hypothetical protein